MQEHTITKSFEIAAETGIDAARLKKRYIRLFCSTLSLSLLFSVLPFLIGMVLHLYRLRDWGVPAISLAIAVPLSIASFFLYKHVTLKFLFSRSLDKYTYLIMAGVLILSLAPGLLDLIAKLQLLKYQ
jgi:hypothetical protein